MPLYDYRCTQCGREVEVMHGIHGSGPETCETCGGTMRKALSTPAIHFKGSGWAKKDAAAASAKKAKPKTGATPSTKDDGEAKGGGDANNGGDASNRGEAKSGDGAQSGSGETTKSDSDGAASTDKGGSPKSAKRD